MPGYFQKHVLEIWNLRPKLGYPDPVFSEALDHVGHEILAAAAQREHAVTLRQIVDGVDRPKTLGSLDVVAGQRHGPVRTVLVDERFRCPDIDDASVIDDRHAVAEALGFFHEVGGQKHRLSTAADVTNEIPD